MSWSEGSGRGIRREEWVVELRPTFGIEQGRSDIRLNDAQGVEIRPAPGSREHNENLVAVQQHFRAFIDIDVSAGQVTVLFPRIGRFRNHGARRIDRPRITHMGNEQILLAVLVTFPSRPHEIVFTFEFERSRVDSPFIAGIAHLGLKSPCPLDRVVIVVLDDIDTMGSIVAGIDGEVDILLVAPAMELGRPQLVRPVVSRLRRPNRFLLCMLRVSDISGFAKSQVPAR